jgi:hypothetical protein
MGLTVSQLLVWRRESEHSATAAIKRLGVCIASRRGRGIRQRSERDAGARSSRTRYPTRRQDTHPVSEQPNIGAGGDRAWFAGVDGMTVVMQLNRGESRHAII